MANNNYRKASKRNTRKIPNLSKEGKDKKNQYAREWYRNLSEKQKEKKHQYGRERYKNRNFFSRIQEIETILV